ncbi:MAG: hypothetical protein Q9160_002013 [Pyrenula sp. 1 TL-2023]
MPVHGPQLPPSPPGKRKREDFEGDDEESSDRSASQNQKPSDNSLKKARSIGPTLPPANIDEVPSKPPEDTSSSSDDDYGPSLPTQPQKSYAVNRAASVQEPQESVKRDSWMMAPPAQNDWSARVDPTKLRNRKFNTSKGAKGPSQAIEEGINAKWTETPGEKKARLEREMMGIQEAKPSREEKRDNPRDQETAKRVREYIEKSRGLNIDKQQEKGTPREKEDDPSARAFDREKDIAGGIKISHSQRKQMMQKASDFGSRFSSSKFL